MRMKGVKFFSVVMVMLVMGLVGCAKSQDAREGFVLEVKGGSILVAQNITMERYNELKDVSSEALIDQGGLDLIWLTYEKAADFKKGDQVEFWLDGGIRESYPAQGDAKKVELK
jgi:hypothetical protein